MRGDGRGGEGQRAAMRECVCVLVGVKRGAHNAEQVKEHRWLTVCVCVCGVWTFF